VDCILSDLLPAVTAFATIVSAIAAAFAAWFSFWSASAAREAATEAKNASKANYRPRIRVGLVISKKRGKDRLVPGEPLEVLVDIVNRGGRDATILESDCVKYVDVGLPMERPYNDAPNCFFIKGHKIKPGESLRNNPLDLGTLTSDGIEEINDCSKNLYILGFIRYEDAEGFPRRTMFCRAYHPYKDRYLAVDDSDYEVEN
jgi:hypothetical protein